MEFKNKLLLIDGHALFHRAFHALPPMSNSQGFPTNAIFGFFSMLFKALADIKPTHALVTFDLPGPTFRHHLAGDYKATRKAAPDELTMQLPKVKEILQALKIPVYEKPGFEADDLLGIISAKTGNETLNMIVTGDLDLLQLIDERTEVYRFKIGLSDIVVYDLRKMKEEFGISPSQWVDYKAIKGDVSDNIPGVKGIGPKGALELVKKFKNLEGIYAAAEAESKEIKPGTAKKLLAEKEKAFLSYKLAKIDPSNHFDFNLQDTQLRNYDKQAVVKIFESLSIKALNSRLPLFVWDTTSPDLSGGVSEVSSSFNGEAERGSLQTLDSKTEIEGLAKKLSAAKGFGIKPVFEEGKFAGLEFELEDQSFYVSVNKTGLKTFGILKSVLENFSIEKYGFDLKTIARTLKDYGVDLKPLSFDRQIAAYLLNPGLRKYDDLPMGQLKLLLKEKNLEKLFYEVEMPLEEALVMMEGRGVKLDLNWLASLSLELDKKIKNLVSNIHSLAGEEFNISSPIQLREILFDKLQIPKENLRKTKKTKALSTGAGELEKLRGLHPIVDLIFEYRELTKLKSTYVDALPELVSKEDKRLHTNYNQTIAATGRLSSNDPNLQNIPIRTDLGNEVRKAFIAEEGKVLLSLDYSQIELRIAASLSGDDEMIKIFNNNGDFHSATAARIFNVEEKQVTSSQRRAAKTINFSVLYGVSAFGLSERTEMERGEAAEYIKKYYQVFGKLKQYIDSLIAEVHQSGFLCNPLGRIRYFPDIHSPNWGLRSAAERAAVNMPIQSLAADIIKLAMINVESKNSELKPECQMILSVHDELVFEVNEKKAEECSKELKKIMESVYNLEVPLVVEAKIGRNWSEMKPIGK